MENLNIKTADDFREYTQQEYDQMTEDKTQGTQVFAVPCSHVLYLYNALIPYVNKAEKLNIPYTITEIGKATITRKIDSKWQDVECLLFTLNFEIKVNGWQFVATIDHLPNGNIVKAIKGVELPIEYRTAKNTTCDHCKTVRYRKSTFVIYNEETKQYQQVGRDCLKVYTGIDVSKVTAVYDIFNLFNDSECYGGSGEDDAWEMYGSFRANRTMYVRTLIALAWDIVSIFGYVKKGSENSTVSMVSDFESYLNGDMKKYSPKRYRMLEKIIADKKMELLSADDYKKADEIIAYVLKQKVTNDYMNNMHILLSEDTVNRKYMGFVVSAIAVYNRGMEKAQEYKKAHENETQSEHIGSIGQRINVLVRECKAVTSWESDYGMTYIYKIVDTQNNILTWKTSKVISNVLSITGTVKAHNDYKGIKQTELTRCKVA